MSAKLIGCMSFVTMAVPHNTCGSNGLPLTPNSIKVLGLAQELIPLRHENLCGYVDFKCGKHDRIFAVSEFYAANIESRIESSPRQLSSDWHKFCSSVTYGILSALKYLNDHGIVHQSLNPKNILLTPDDRPKLSNYGMHYMTDGGKLILCPLGSPKYSSPEQLICCFNPDVTYDAISSKSDVWSVSVIVLELAHRELLWKGEDNQFVISHVLGLCQHSSSQRVIQTLVEFFENKSVLFENSDFINKLRFVMENGLAVEQQYRMTPVELTQNAIFKEFHKKPEPMFVVDKLGKDFSDYDESNEVNPMDDLECDELWYLWNLAGGDMLSDVMKTVTTTSSIKKVPLFVTSSGDVMGLEASPEALFDPSFTVLSMDTVEKRLVITDDNVQFIYPLLEGEDSSETEHDASKLPLLIKENDFGYQVYRIALFKRLLIAYPYLRDRLWREARIDIPPFCRGKVWSGLLDVVGNVEEQYLHLDKETPIITDRQIAVDVPRCHQYNAVLSSPVAHRKLKRVLKAWLMAHRDLTYWQGLDSLCAVFVHLNFNDEPRAFGSMSLFIDKYLHKFFMKDNSPIIQEYLAVFSHLIAFHDPSLACHLDEISFIPELYAIPWFLTMFAHVFPLHKIVHLWDTLLLGNSSFPLCIGVAILQQLRGQLLQYDFNECILLFSDLPEIDIDAVVQKSIQIFCHTPKSSTFRVHAQQETKPKREPSSYYSEDYNSSPKNELTVMSIPLADLKKELCCRISADDLIQLCELRGTNDSKTPAKSSRTSKPRIGIIDVRPSDDFARGSIPSSINYPFPGKSQSAFIHAITQQKYKVTVVVGNQGTKDDILFAEELLKSSMKGVCVLHGGIDILKPTGILTVP